MFWLSFSHSQFQWASSPPCTILKYFFPTPLEHELILYQQLHFLHFNFFFLANITCTEVLISLFLQPQSNSFYGIQFSSQRKLCLSRSVATLLLFGPAFQRDCTDISPSILPPKRPHRASRQA